MSERTVPEVRFRGFSGEWEKRKFTDVIERTSTICDDAKLPRVEYEDIIPEYGRLNKNIYVKESKKTGLLFESGDILFGKLRPYLKNWLISDFRGIAVGDFWIFTPNKAVANFVFYLIQNSSFQYVANLSSGTKMPRSDWNIVSKSEFAIATDQAEQTKIVEFFKNLDDLITQKQKKYDKLVHMKKACLDKMFPKEGADTPEVRLKGFGGEWERKKITDIAYVFIGLVTTMTKFYCNEGVLLIRNSDIKDNRFEFSESPIYLEETFADANANRKLLIGDVITVHTGDVGTSAVVTKNETGAIGFATINTRANQTIIKPHYLSTYFNSSLHKNYAIKMSTGDGRSNYNLRDFNELIVPVPTLSEQTKIGAFFQTLDNLIALRKTELEKLKNIKKACLDKMFI